MERAQRMTWRGREYRRVSLSDVQLDVSRVVWETDQPTAGGLVEAQLSPSGHYLRIVSATAPTVYYEREVR